MTDKDGGVYEHMEYFPFGETWVEEASNTERTPYLFTSKELDRETGLYYFGSRYNDPRTNVWQSPDPILGSYLSGRPNGGVFKSKNLNLFAYVGQSPVSYIDPNGDYRYNIVIVDATDSPSEVRERSNPKTYPGRKIYYINGRYHYGSMNRPTTAPKGFWSKDENQKYTLIIHAENKKDIYKGITKLLNNKDVVDSAVIRSHGWAQVFVYGGEDIENKSEASRAGSHLRKSIDDSGASVSRIFKIVIASCYAAYSKKYRAVLSAFAEGFLKGDPLTDLYLYGSKEGVSRGETMWYHEDTMMEYRSNPNVLKPKEGIWGRDRNWRELDDSEFEKATKDIIKSKSW